ncbi:hypothetical protein [Paraflavitalea speifideaquila]|uniref:hypothetical protein n=1 Tax=Paraflavitalea speifideaquila TaxID=3076558 RepID=UPI0028E27EB7|nr:hypothetical protein [Paraflavitalea speifideiaquila]
MQVKADEIGILQKQLDLITFQHFQRVRALCKPEQVLKFDTVVKEIVNRMTGGWRNPGKPGAPKDSAAVKNSEKAGFEPRAENKQLAFSYWLLAPFNPSTYQPFFPFSSICQNCSTRAVQVFVAAT